MEFEPYPGGKVVKSVDFSTHQCIPRREPAMRNAKAGATFGFAKCPFKSMDGNRDYRLKAHVVVQYSRMRMRRRRRAASNSR